MMRGHRVPGWVWTLAALVVIVLLLILAAISTSGDHPIVFLGRMYTNSLIQDYDGAEAVTVSLVIHAGDVFVDGGAPGALSADINTTYEGDYPTLAYTVENGHGMLQLEQPPLTDLILLGGTRLSVWGVQLGKSAPLALQIAIGDGYLDLGARNLPLTALDITTESADLELDLRGEWVHDLPVTIRTGRGDVTLRLPEAVGVQVLAGARPSQLDAGDFVWKDDGTLVNAAYGSAEVTLTVAITSARGRITLRGG